MCSRPILHIRHEPFEYGLLPLPNLVFPDPLPTLRSLRKTLLANANYYSMPPTNYAGKLLKEENSRINTAGIAESLDIPMAHAQLVLQTLASVLVDYGSEADPLSRANAKEIDTVGADIDNLLIFLYLQSYKKPLPRPHKDAATVADVWPSTSVFDRFLSTITPLQVRSNRKMMPSLAEEKAHQLIYIQKHLSSILSLIAEPMDEDDIARQVLSIVKFNHLGFLFCVGEKGTEMLPLSQAAPFFANSDSAMPAAPVPLVQVLEWVAAYLESPSVNLGGNDFQKQNGRNDRGCSLEDVTMVDSFLSYSTSSEKKNVLNQENNLHREELIFLDGVCKTSLLKEDSQVKKCSLKVANCHDAVIYVLAPLKYVSIYGCSDSILVLGPVEKALKLEHCERVQLIVAAVRICIANCRECLFYLGVNEQPVMLGDNHKLQIAPYNTFYPKLGAHMVLTGVDPTVNKWDKILTFGVVDPHDSLSHPAGIADAQAEGATVLPPDQYMNFLIPDWSNDALQNQFSTRANPFVLPKAYLLAQLHRNKSVEILRQTLKTVPVDESTKRDLSNAIHLYFKEWLYASGNIRQLYDVQFGDQDPKAME